VAVTASILKPSLSGAVTGKSRLTAKRSYTAIYQLSAEQEDGPGVIIDYFKGSPDHPFIGDRYNLNGYRDNSVRCKSITPRRIDSGVGQWLAAVEWEPPEGTDDDDTETGTDINGEDTDNPLEWHDEIDVGYTQLSIPVEQARFKGCNRDGGIRQRITGLDLDTITMPCNSALVPFDPGIEKEIDIKVVRITKNLESYDANFFSNFIGRVNSDKVVINKREYKFRDVWSPLNARIKQISGTFQITNKIPYWKQTVEVHVNPLGWRRLLLDRGVEELFRGEQKDYQGNTISNSDERVGKLQQKQDADGYPITTPVPFDGNGRALAEGKPAVFLEWQIYEEIPFAPLNW